MATQYHVYINGSGSSSYVYVTIDGTKYSSASTVLRNEGTNISVTAKKSITLNGKTVGTSTAMGLYNYTFPLVADTTITLNGSTSIQSAEIVYTEPVAPAPEPEQEHTTNIGAAAFQIESGTVRYGGAAYEIESGMTRVNGVAYEIPLTKKPPVITVTGTGNSRTCRVEINGNFHHEAVTVEVETGTVIVLYSENIHINGVLVATNATSAGHEYTVNGAVRIELAYSAKQSNNIYLYEE